MIELFRKGFRLDIPRDTVVTFKKAQNLNGVQARYAYSNTISADKTANIKKLLELFDLPSGKVVTLRDGFEIDVVLNGSIQLRNQTLKVQKETLDKVELYLLYSDSSLLTKLKQIGINSVTSEYKYKNSIGDFLLSQDRLSHRAAFVETQPKSGYYVINEMPILINLRHLLKTTLENIGYTTSGDFFAPGNTVLDYYIAPNKGVYHVYPGTGDGYAPAFDDNLDMFTFLNQTLALMNCYADVDDTFKTISINNWTSINNYKSNFVDYSKYFLNYQDYTFQGKLAKRNDLTYSDSGTAFNYFFSNNLSSELKSTYLSSAFGTGSLNTFDDAKLLDGGLLETRPDNTEGEVSAVRIFKISNDDITTAVYSNGVASTVTGKKAEPVSMGVIYDEFHKGYTDFILTPLVVNIIFRYDDILAAEFSLSKVFFIDKLSSYWLPLEINFSTKKDQIVIKAMLVNKRKVPAPILNNFNSVLLDFKEKALFPLSYLQTMYPIPPNQYPWETVIFRSYDQNLNALYINDVLIPANTLPQSFDLSAIVSMKIEANKPADTTPDTNTASLYLQAVDTNGGVSNQAYINIKHSGKAVLESNFIQNDPITYTRTNFNFGILFINAVNYAVGPKPNLNSTVTSAAQIYNETAVNDDFNLIVAGENYTDVKVEISAFTLYLKSKQKSPFSPVIRAKLIVFNGVSEIELYETSVSANEGKTVLVPAHNLTIPNLSSGTKVRVYLKYLFNNNGPIGPLMDAETSVSGMAVNIKTTKII